MLTITRSHKFEKDILLAVKRGFDLSLLNDVIEKLANEEKLDAKYKDHALKGKLSGFREYHILPLKQ